MYMQSIARTGKIQSRTGKFFQLSDLMAYLHMAIQI